jgi:hypothetical protein
MFSSSISKLISLMMLLSWHSWIGDANSETVSNVTRHTNGAGINTHTHRLPVLPQASSTYYRTLCLVHVVGLQEHALHCSVRPAQSLKNIMCVRRKKYTVTTNYLDKTETSARLEHRPDAERKCLAPKIEHSNYIRRTTCNYEVPTTSDATPNHQIRWKVHS